MRRIWVLAFVSLTLLPGCGLYGEKGFSGKNRVSATRFIEDVDKECGDIRRDLDDKVTLVLRSDPRATDDAGDGVNDLRNAIDTLTEQLPVYNGPEKLEDARDRYVITLRTVDKELDAARKALKDKQVDTYRGHAETALTELTQAEVELRAAGFKECGVLRPSD